MINKIKQKFNNDKIVTILISILLLLVPMHRLITYTLFQLNINSVLYYMKNSYYLWAFLPILSIIYIVNVLTDNYDVDKFDIIIYILILLGVISTIKSVDVHISVYGRVSREEGLITVLTYFLIFLNIKNLKEEKNKHTIINIVLIVGILQVTYGLLQVYTPLNIIRKYKINYMASGLSGNPNFLGTYLTITSLISTTLYLIKKRKVYLIFTILFFIGLILAASTGPFLAYIISFIFLIIVFRKEVNYKNCIKLVILLTLLFFLSNNLILKTNKNDYIDPNYNISKEIESTVTKKDNINPTNGRIELWKKSLPLVKDYWLTGAGYDNFRLAYYYNAMSRIKYDKAHNVYLEILICNGIPYLIVYCTLCLLVFIKGFRIKDPFYIAIYIAFIGYSIQAFANINVTDITWIYFIIMALIVNRQKQTN